MLNKRHASEPCRWGSEPSGGAGGTGVHQRVGEDAQDRQPRRPSDQNGAPRSSAMPKKASMEDLSSYLKVREVDHRLAFKRCKTRYIRVPYICFRSVCIYTLYQQCISTLASSH